jgi:hypothetical protein
MSVETMRRALVEFAGTGTRHMSDAQVVNAYTVYQETFSLRAVLAAMN